MASNTTISPLLNLPLDIVILLPQYLHDVDDLVHLLSSCRAMRALTPTIKPQIILRLASSKLRTFFHQDPYFLVCTVARQIGDWARKSEANEAELIGGLPRGIEFLAELALREDVGCGVTLEHIRQCLRHVHPRTFTMEQLIHVAIYGELFGPDFDTFFSNSPPSVLPLRMLKVKTRVAYLTYCVPDEAYGLHPVPSWTNGGGDPEYKLIIHPDGPYRLMRMYHNPDRFEMYRHLQMLLSLVRSPIRWGVLWRRARTGEEPLNPHSYAAGSSWQGTLLEKVLQCQGLAGLNMMSFRVELREPWRPKIEEWQAKIDGMEKPPTVNIMGLQTHEYPDLANDLLVAHKILNLDWRGA